jgi:Pyridoxamine 5'-phosphate oxidase
LAVILSSSFKCSVECQALRLYSNLNFMSKVLENITPDLAGWIEKQSVFFVATAPLSAAGHPNVSPKGGDSFRILGPMEAAYQDYTGSGAETIAHLRENGRIVIMFCAFDGPPRVVRLHGRGTVLRPRDKGFTELASRFPANPGTRGLIHVRVTRVSTSCGYAVPLFDFRQRRDQLDRWAEAKGPDALAAYRIRKNTRSIDGLPAFDEQCNARP